VFTNPMQTTADYNTPEMREAGWPAVGGIASARSLATLYGELARDRVLSATTLDAASQPQVDGMDLTLRNRSVYGLGFQLPSDMITFGPDGGFGHDGAGGSMAFADRSARLGFAYIPNQMGTALGTDLRARRLTDAVYASL
jgi:CubicO group peptidase (beta-lactamase class C family)